MAFDALVRADIEHLIHQYAISFDAKDSEGVWGLFTDDVHLDYLGGVKVLDGIAAVRREMFRFGPVPLPGVDRIVHSHHQMRVDWLRAGDPDRDGSPTATGQTSCIAHLAVIGDEGRSLVVRGVQYQDAFRRTPDGWRFAARRHYALWESRQPADIAVQE